MFNPSTSFFYLFLKIQKMRLLLIYIGLYYILFLLYLFVGEHTDDVLIQLKKDIADNQEVLMQVLKNTKRRDLTLSEEIEIGRFNQSLTEHAERRHRELSLKLDVMDGKMDAMDGKIDAMARQMDFLLKLQNDSKSLPMTAKEIGHRTQLLKEAQLLDAQLKIDTTKLLGEGSFAKVYLGTLNRSMDVAVKCIKLGSLQGMQKEKCENEVILMKVIDHVNILKCYGYHIPHGEESFHMVLEVAPCGSLSALLSDTQRFPILPFSLKLLWLCELCSAVAYLHSKRIKHRDIKAENMLLFNGLHCKLCDFGVAKENLTGGTTVYQGRGTVVGTFDFMAPEVMFGLGYCDASEVYSIALTGVQIINRSTPKIRQIADFIRKMCDNYALVPASYAPRLKGWLLDCVKESERIEELNRIRPTAQQSFDLISSLFDQSRRDSGKESALLREIEWVATAKFSEIIDGQEDNFYTPMSAKSPLGKVGVESKQGSVSEKGTTLHNFEGYLLTYLTSP